MYFFYLKLYILLCDTKQCFKRNISKNYLSIMQELFTVFNNRSVDVIKPF